MVQAGQVVHESFQCSCAGKWGRKEPVFNYIKNKTYEQNHFWMFRLLSLLDRAEKLSCLKHAVPSLQYLIVRLISTLSSCEERGPDTTWSGREEPHSPYISVKPAGSLYSPGSSLISSETSRKTIQLSPVSSRSK